MVWSELALPTKLGNLGPGARAVVGGDIAFGLGNVDGEGSLVVHGLSFISLDAASFTAVCDIPHQCGR